MTYTFFTTSSESDEEEEDQKYSSFVDVEDFEEDDTPGGFEGLQKGSSLEESSGETSERGEEEGSPPSPWDPSENFFAYI